MRKCERRETSDSNSEKSIHEHPPVDEPLTRREGVVSGPLYMRPVTVKSIGAAVKESLIHPADVQGDYTRDEVPR